MSPSESTPEQDAYVRNLPTRARVLFVKLMRTPGAWVNDSHAPVAYTEDGSDILGTGLIEHGIEVATRNADGKPVSWWHRYRLTPAGCDAATKSAIDVQAALDRL